MTESVSGSKPTVFQSNQSIKNAARWIVSALLLAALPSQELILTGTGNKPLPDRNWSPGATNVANLPSRFGWWEGPPFGGGEWHFEFMGDTAAFQEALDAFAKINAPALDLFVHDGTQHSFVLDPNHTNKTGHLDLTFTVWDTNQWEAMCDKDTGTAFSDDPNAGKSRPAPRLDVYPGSGERIDRVKVPASVSLHDERAATAGVDTSAGTVLVATIKDASTRDPVPGTNESIVVWPTGSLGIQVLNASGQGVEVLSAGVHRLSIQSPARRLPWATAMNMSVIH